MAAAITTTATSLESQVMEVAKALEEAEFAFNAANPTTPVNNVSIALDVEGQTISVSATFPAVLSGAGGAVTLTPSNYLP